MSRTFRHRKISARHRIKVVDHLSMEFGPSGPHNIAATVMHFNHHGLADGPGAIQVRAYKDQRFTVHALRGEGLTRDDFIQTYGKTKFDLTFGFSKNIDIPEEASINAGASAVSVVDINGRDFNRHPRMWYNYAYAGVHGPDYTKIMSKSEFRSYLGHIVGKKVNRRYAFKYYTRRSIRTKDRILCHKILGGTSDPDGIDLHRISPNRGY